MDLPCPACAAAISCYSSAANVTLVAFSPAIAIVFLLGLFLGLLLAFLLLFRYRGRPRPPHKVPDHFSESTLATACAVRLGGAPADGSRPLPIDASGPVIWVDHGDEAVVHLESLQTRILDGMLLVSVDLETDQTGRTPLVMTFALGNASDPAGLVAATDDLPRGNGMLAARWGRVVQDAVWSSLLALARDHADERDAAPNGISAVAGQLSFHAGAPFQAGLSSSARGRP